VQSVHVAAPAPAAAAEPHPAAAPARPRPVTDSTAPVALGSAVVSTSDEPVPDDPGATATTPTTPIP
jgi:hypothetical protein